MEKKPVKITVCHSWSTNSAGGRMAYLSLKSSNNEIELCSELYFDLAGAKRAAKRWHKRIPNSVIIDTFMR